MSYIPTEWINTVYDSEGNILRKGTPLLADNMNKIESELENLSQYPSKVDNNIQKVKEHDERIEIVENEIDGIKISKGQLNGIATLDENGIVPSTQLPSNLKEIRVVNTLTDRDVLETFEGLRVMVLDASADETVNSGWAEYVWNGIAFIKVAEAEGIDLIINWEDVIEKPTQFPPSKHSHKESEISDLDKYTRQEVDNKLAEKSNDGHKHTEEDITNLDKYTKQEVDNRLAEKAEEDHSHNEFQSMSNTLANHDGRLELLEEGSGQLHEHNNKTALDKITYSGSKPSIDLITLDELENHTHNYENLDNKPSIPSKISHLEDDSEFIKSNANRITISATAPSNPKQNDIWIVI